MHLGFSKVMHVLGDDKSLIGESNDAWFGRLVGLVDDPGIMLLCIVNMVYAYVYAPLGPRDFLVYFPIMIHPPM